jgi:streptomycin 3"-adenylyltransferase
MAGVPPRVETYVEEVTKRLSEALDLALVGAYLHGSAALGDFSESRSDIDVLAVSTRRLSAREKTSLAERLAQRALPCPATGLELHVVCRDGIGIRDAPRFDFHLATSTDGRPDRTVDGEGHPGDPDLVMHFAVLHEHGRALLGPAPATVFPAIPREMLLAAFRGELQWATKNGSPSYQVLNACRAWRFADEGVLSSKTAGAEWARGRVDDPSPIDAALRHRRGLTDEHPEPNAARELLAHALCTLERGNG